MKDKCYNRIISLWNSLSNTDWIVLIVYQCLNLVFLFFHEPWRDEAEAWVIARDYSFLQVLYHLSSEGQPLLWFLLVLPFAKAGFPYVCFGCVSYLICGFAAYFFLRYCRFKKIYRWLILFSFIFTYYNPVICRSYSLVLLLIVMLTGVWETRYEEPLRYGILVALLFQSHLLVSGIAIGCMLDQLICAIFGSPASRTKLWIGSGISITSFLLLILEMYPFPSKVFQPSVNFTHLFANLQTYDARSKLRILFNTLYRMEDQRIVVIVLIGIAILLFTLTVLQFAGMIDKDKGAVISLFGWVLTVWLGICAYFFIVICVREANHIQLALVLMMILLFAVCTARPKRLRLPKMLYLWNLRILFILMCLAGYPRLVRSICSDMTGLFSNSGEMADFIKENTPAKSVVAVRDDYCIPSVSAYFRGDMEGIVFWNICTDNEFVNYEWGYPYPLADINKVKERFAGENIYYLSSTGYEAVIPLDDITLIPAEDEYSVMGESFYLYEVRQ